MAKRKAKEQTPFKQTKISNFFQRNSPKRHCSGAGNIPESPDVILCSPTATRKVRTRRRDSENVVSTSVRKGLVPKSPDIVLGSPAKPERKTTTKGPNGKKATGDNNKSVTSSAVTNSMAPAVPESPDIIIDSPTVPKGKIRTKGRDGKKATSGRRSLFPVKNNGEIHAKGKSSATESAVDPISTTDVKPESPNEVELKGKFNTIQRDTKSTATSSTLGKQNRIPFKNKGKSSTSKSAVDPISTTDFKPECPSVVELKEKLNDIQCETKNIATASTSGRQSLFPVKNNVDIHAKGKSSATEFAVDLSTTDVKPAPPNEVGLKGKFNTIQRDTKSTATSSTSGRQSLFPVKNNEDIYAKRLSSATESAVNPISTADVKPGPPNEVGLKGKFNTIQRDTKSTLTSSSLGKQSLVPVKNNEELLSKGKIETKQPDFKNIATSSTSCTRSLFSAMDNEGKLVNDNCSAAEFLLDSITTIKGEQNRKERTFQEKRETAIKSPPPKRALADLINVDLSKSPMKINITDAPVKIFKSDVDNLKDEIVKNTPRCKRKVSPKSPFKRAQFSCLEFPAKISYDIKFNSGMTSTTNKVSENSAMSELKKSSISDQNLGDQENVPPIKKESPNSPGNKNKEIENLFEDLDSAFFECTPPSSENIKKNSPISKKCLKELNVENIANDFLFDDFIDDWSSEKSINYDLTFDHCVRCVVERIDITGSGINHEKILIVKEKKSGLIGRCVLKDMWAFGVEVSPNDEVNILAKKYGENWVIDSQNGYICLYPDLLVSSTSLVGAMFCRRRGILSNIFKGLDSDNKIMILGSLVHELLQESLKVANCDRDKLENIVDELLTIPSNLRVLYSANMTLEETKLEINHFIPFILNFLNIYVTQLEKPTGNNFKGTITDVVDIEEAVSSLNLGIKGRIDVTVKVNINGETKIMPLELKTGRASFSNEHRSQVILYTMMMSDVGQKVESGLLLYLKEGIMEEMIPNNIEIRDLILLRNDFAKYLHRFDPSNLPEPIRFANACRKCPYKTVCSAFLDETIPKSHPIRTLDVLIEPSHLEYFHRWSKLLLLEDSFGFGGKNDMKIINLTLEDGVVPLKNEFKHTFKRNIVEDTAIVDGNFVMVTSQTFSQTYLGKVIHISSNICSVSLQKEIINKSGTFTIECYRSTLLSRYMTNLGYLLEEPFENLRKIIIDQEPATFSPKFAKSLLTDDCLKILSSLNKDQQVAVLKVLTSENYLLIEGPPGTGKTQTVASLIKVLSLLGQNILLVGHTHSSVDNILKRIPDVQFLRMGSLTNIDESLHDKSYVQLIKNAKTVTDVKNLMNCNIIASTCLGLDADIVAKRKFDVCIVDESSQVLQPEVLKPLFPSKKFVLIGDPKQLGPVVKSIEAKEKGMGESIFEKLQNPSSVVTLTFQYRMNAVIMELANNLTYNGILKAGSEEIGSKTFNCPENISENWLKFVFSPKLENSIVFLDTSNYLTDYPSSLFSNHNQLEIKIIEKMVIKLLDVGVDPNTIGVMAPFRAQIQKLTSVLPTVEVNTVDQYQGRDKDVIIYSCTKQDRNLGMKGEHELLNDQKRLTVGITRAKLKLIIIGDKCTLSNYKTFQHLFCYLRNDCIFALKNGENDFVWPDV